MLSRLMVVMLVLAVLVVPVAAQDELCTREDIIAWRGMARESLLQVLGDDIQDFNLDDLESLSASESTEAHDRFSASVETLSALPYLPCMANFHDEVLAMLDGAATYISIFAENETRIGILGDDRFFPTLLSMTEATGFVQGYLAAFGIDNKNFLRVPKSGEEN